MLQTIYEAESRFPSDRLWRILDGREVHAGSVEVKPEVLAVLEPASPLDLSTDSRMPALGGGDSDAWERRLQRELLLIQKQQQIQKQLLISEFRKQHENLTRQHQAQLQEHLKLQQELLAMKKQQQEQNLEKERRLEQRSAELEDAHRHEQERQRREKHVLVLRSKERARESAMASTEVKQKLQDFLLNRPAKDGSSSHVTGYRPKLWLSQHMSMDQSPPSLGTASSAYKCTLPSPPDGKDSFPLRKTASEPNLKLRSRLKQKVAERRSSPLMCRKDGSVLMVPYKKRVLEFAGSIASSSAPGSGPSSPNDSCGGLGPENGASRLPVASQSERLLSLPRLLKPDDSMRLLYTSPSLPNITLALPPAASPSPIAAATALKEASSDVGSDRQVLPAHFLGAMPPVALESKVNSSHQALLQHLLHKEQMRQQKILPPGIGSVPVLPPSPLAVRERPSPNLRPKLPRHRPLNRTQSAPLPQSTLAQLVIQQQHQSFVEKQKQYQQQVYINQMLSQSIEQLRQPSDNLQEEEEEREQCARHMLPPGGVIRKYSHSGSTCSSDGEPPDAHAGVIRVKEEPPDSEDEDQAQGAGLGERDARLQQVGGGDVPQRVVIRAIM
ncbi:histone deacetylase 9-B isoform X2 [Brienomyrus brachyistius]|uniref:histone deacetylase 9-B isoform X2 n=1 Tax=Brienomyrus brachyistius TaxID=42636 RepID=UPI0020B3FF9E|nr:histone deacetylase 9-B isoform X2 [Brienomyrus brachyistius]